jgi:competence protein ComEA
MAPLAVGDGRQGARTGCAHCNFTEEARMKTPRWIKGTLISLALFAGPLSAAGPVDINAADAQTLAEALDGVGPAKAQAIVDYRAANGPFKSVDDLENVKGIGQSTLEKNRGRMTVEPVAAPAGQGAAVAKPAGNS